MKTINYEEPCMSLVTNHTKVEGCISPAELYDLVKGDTYKSNIDAIRASYLSGNKGQADGLKKSLPAVTVSGTFKEHRKTENLDTYSGYICLDIDDLDPSTLVRMKATAMELPYIVMAFISPSGFGLKVIVKVSTESEDHKMTYKQVQSSIEKELDCVCDKTNDVARLCYISHDPDAYFNEGAEVFQVAVDTQQVTPQQFSSEVPSAVIPVSNNKTDIWLNYAVMYTDNVKNFEGGNRNNYLHTFACNCNRFGISHDSTLSFAVSRFEEDGFRASEITKTVNSAYNNKSEYGKWYESHRKRVEGVADADQQYHPANNMGVMIKSSSSLIKDETVTVPDEVYVELPELLETTLVQIPDKRERDVALTATLVLLSSMLPKVYGVYDGKIVYPNLYAMVLAPPANNKGIIKSVAQAYGDITSGYMLPGNGTSTVIMEYLAANKGVGLICETEADALGYIINKDHEGFNHIVNNAFHNEPINVARKSMGNTVWVNNPKLSMLLSGIPEQAGGIIRGTHNGIFSRFIPYLYNSTYVWKDVSQATQSFNPNIHHERVSDFKGYLKELQRENIQFDFTNDQWQQFNNHYGLQLRELGVVNASDMSAVVKRMGLITFRIAMILSVVRCYENGEGPTTIMCTDTDFIASIRLASVYLQHAEMIYNSVEANSNKIAMSNNLRVLYDALPEQFDRKTALGVVDKSNISLSNRTVDKYLKQLVSQGLLEYSYNNYSKKPRTIDITQSNSKAA